LGSSVPDERIPATVAHDPEKQDQLVSAQLHLGDMPPLPEMIPR